jgi:hypothetical protein
MRVKIFLEVVALDILMPLALALDGDAAVFRTVMVVDFSPDVSHRIDRNWCAMPRRRAGIWLHWRSAHNGRCTSHRWCMHRRGGAGILCGWLMPPLLRRHVDGSDNELVDVMTSLLCHCGSCPGWMRVVEQLACRQQRGVDALCCRWCSGHTDGTLRLTFYHDCGST